MEDAIVPSASASSHHPSAHAAFSPSPVSIKQEPISRESTPFFHRPSIPPSASRHATPLVPAERELVEARPVTPLPSTEIEIPCSQETVSTAPLADDPQTPVKPKLEDDAGTGFTVGGVFQESPSANQLSRRKRGKRRKSGKPGLEQTTTTTTTTTSPPSANTPMAPRTIGKTAKPKTMRLTHANKAWFDLFTAKHFHSDAGDSNSASHESHPPLPLVAPPHPHFQHALRYVKEILARSLSWSLLPLRWTIHWAALYILPLAIVVAIFSVLLYLLLPRSIFSVLPSILSTTTTILAFPAKIMVSKGPELWCGYVGLGCGRDDAEHEENFRNATFATDLEVRNAHTVITNLNQLNDSSLRLSLDSVNIHSVGDAALHMSNWTDRAYIAQQFYSLGSQSFTLGRSVTKLEVKGKAVMAHILNLYGQLWIKLEGSWEGKYSFEDVTAARDSLLEEVERALKDLQEHVHVTGEIADKALELAQRVGGEVLKQRGAIASQSMALEANQAWWRVSLPAAFQWDKLSSIQARTLAEDLKLTAASLSVVDSVKKCLVEMGLRLEAFHESVVYARTENRKRTYMGLSVEDLLKSLEDNLAKSRKAMDAWSNEKD